MVIVMLMTMCLEAKWDSMFNIINSMAHFPISTGCILSSPSTRMQQFIVFQCISHVDHCLQQPEGYTKAPTKNDVAWTGRDDDWLVGYHYQ